MPAHDLVLLREQLREQYDRQTAAWIALKERFAALPEREIRVANHLLERLTAPVVPAGGCPVLGNRA
jgi:hypothetical protein